MLMNSFHVNLNMLNFMYANNVENAISISILILVLNARNICKIKDSVFCSIHKTFHPYGINIMQ